MKTRKIDEVDPVRSLVQDHVRQVAANLVPDPDHIQGNVVEVYRKLVQDLDHVPVTKVVNDQDDLNHDRLNQNPLLDQDHVREAKVMHRNEVTVEVVLDLNLVLDQDHVHSLLEVVVRPDRGLHVQCLVLPRKQKHLDHVRHRAVEAHLVLVPEVARKVVRAVVVNHVRHRDHDPDPLRKVHQDHVALLAHHSVPVAHHNVLALKVVQTKHKQKIRFFKINVFTILMIQ